VTVGIVGSVLYGADEHVADFVSQRVPHMQGARFTPPYWAIGVVRNDALVGGVVFHNARYSMQGKMIDVEMGAAFDASDWCRPSTLRRLFEFPFVTLDSPRMTTITARKNKAARLIDEGLGFKLEGVHPQAIDGKADAVSYGMLRANCLWIDPSKRTEALKQLRLVRAKWKKD
jgi:RimJ/RimL family protein N-acetyltransferase